MVKEALSETIIDLDGHPGLKEFYEKLDSNETEYVISIDISSGEDQSVSVAFVQNKFGKWVFDSIIYF